MTTDNESGDDLDAITDRYCQLARQRSDDWYTEQDIRHNRPIVDEADAARRQAWLARHKPELRRVPTTQAGSTTRLTIPHPI